MVVLYFSYNFVVVVQRGEPCLPVPPFDQKSNLFFLRFILSSFEQEGKGEKENINMRKKH